VAEAGLSTAQAAVLAHLRQFFAGHRVDVREPPDARVQERIPRFGIAAVAPGPVIDKHVYVSIGCWEAVHDAEHGLEFVLVAPDAAPRHALRVAVTAYYHANPDDATFRLDLGHARKWSAVSRMVPASAAGEGDVAREPGRHPCCVGRGHGRTAPATGAE